MTRPETEQPPRLPSFRLDGRLALVTGAGSGLGAAIALGLAEAGAELVLVGRTEATLHETAQAIAALGGRGHVAVCDVTDAAVVRELIGSLPRLDVLVNNAGSNFVEPFLEVTDDHLDTLLALNVRAAFVVAQASVRKMLEAPDRAERGGSVINMSSQMGHVGGVERSVYCMTKHALEGLSKAMAVELAPRGIRVNTIGPTFADTPLVRRVIDTPERRSFVTDNIPAGRLCRLEDVMAAALYLASPASAMVTGTHLIVDGGWTAR